VPDDRRRRNLTAVLGFLLLLPEAPELRLLHKWADAWSAVGSIVTGHRTGYDLDLRQYGDGHWRATFYVTGLVHSILGGSAWKPYGVAGRTAGRVDALSTRRGTCDGQPSKCAQMTRSRSHRILIVEDERRVSEFIRDALTEIGYAVEVASGGADALNKVHHDAPDLVLLDLNLPDMPGFEVLDRLRAQSFTVPVVIVSGNTDPLMAEAARALGAVDYVTKPFALERLTQAVQMVLGTPS